ncbi:MAG: HEAT repeat domain-containing protein [Acidimicrobiales bacterium]
MRTGLADDDPVVRASALRALGRLGLLGAELEAAHRDPSPVVRHAAAQLCADPSTPDPSPLLGDDDDRVVEVTAWALGERGRCGDRVLGALTAVAADHSDPACRESAVAALGALGDERAIPAIIAALGDRPAIRRRAVIALAPFEGPEVEQALREATGDRDRQVRDAAQALVAEGY